MQSPGKVMENDENIKSLENYKNIKSHGKVKILPSHIQNIATVVVSKFVWW